MSNNVGVLAPADAAGRAHQHHRRVARGKPNLAPQMSSSEFPRLCYNEAYAVVAISDQIVVAKEETGTERRSDDAEFGKNRLHRGVKRRAGQRLEIKPEAAPGVVFAPLSNGIRLRIHCRPFGRRCGRPNSGADPLTAVASVAGKPYPYATTRTVPLVTGSAALHETSYRANKQPSWLIANR
jgi:hypothetical protein